MQDPAYAAQEHQRRVSLWVYKSDPKMCTVTLDSHRCTPDLFFCFLIFRLGIDLVLFGSFMIFHRVI